MLNISSVDLDGILSALPPPPQARTRRPTRTTIAPCERIVARSFGFVGEAEEDEKAKYPLVDEGGDRIRMQASTMVSSSIRNEGTILKVNMSIRNVRVVKSPTCLDRGRRRLPKKTDIACWWCRHGFETQPIGCPFKITRTKQIHTMGMFCSCECALAYANDSHSHRMKLFSGSMTIYMRKVLLDVNFDVPLYPAPHWTSLKAYGGILSIEDFRKNCSKITAIPEYLPLYPCGYNLFLARRGDDMQRMRGNVFQEKKRAESVKRRNQLRKIARMTQTQKNFRKYSSLKLKMVKVSRKGRKTKNLFRKPKKTIITI